MNIDYNLLFCNDDKTRHSKRKDEFEKLVANFNKPKRPRLERYTSDRVVGVFGNIHPGL